MNRSLAVLMLAVLVGCTTTAGPLQASSVQGRAVQFGEWVLGCDNTGICRAVTPVTVGSWADEPIYLAVIFGPARDDAPAAMLMREGQVIEALPPLAQRDVIAGRLMVGAGQYAIPAAGYEQMLHAIDEWREAAMGHDLPLIRVDPLPVVPIDDPVVHPALQDFADYCPPGHFGQSLQAWRSIDGRVLWRAGCGNEGLNPASFWFMSGPQGAPLEPVRFAGIIGTHGVFNAWLESTTGYLRVVHYFGGHEIYAYEDCGIYRAFAWNGTEMVLAEQREMPVCGTGIGPHGWISTFRAVTLNAADSGPR